MRRKLAASIAAGAILSLLAAGSAFGQEKILVRTELQDTQPKYIKNADGSFGGLCVDYMRLIEKYSNFKFAYPSDFTPNKRIEANVAENKTDCFFAWSPTPSREANGVFSEVLFEATTIILVRADDDIAITSLDQLRELAAKDGALTVGQTATETYLKNDLKIAVDGSINVLEGNLDKLLAKRARFLIYHNLGIEVAKNPPYLGKVKILPFIIQTQPQYLVFSKGFPKKYVDEISAVIRKLKASGEWDRTYHKYF